ncbi:saccharopine dehydrogenase NADP-binding domain-containing protein [Bacillus sp. JJ1127]|uniref:saccharopine dehydrogenase NADP-binding domain-containing protein n=1 Tax=Bacillus sp. JJ1127 TaxID=3122952 RepID=UPI003000EDFF
MKKIMVVGASGVLGKLVCTELLRIFNNQVKLTVTDYKAARGMRLAKSFDQEVMFQYLDVTNEENTKKILKNIDIVIVILKQQNPYIQKACVNNDILCIDVTPFTDFVKKIEILHQDTEKNEVGSIVMSGFFPGLSGLMVKKAVSNFHEITEVNVGLLQNTNAKAGISGILDMLKIISQRVDYYEDRHSTNLSGFSKKRRMYFFEPNDNREVRLIDHAEKQFLQKALHIKNINYWTSWNSVFFNKQISFLKKFGLIDVILKLNNNKFLSKIVKHNPNKNEDAFLTVEVTGVIDDTKCKKTLSLSTFSDYHLTAMVTAALAKIAVNKKITGVVFPSELTSVDEILSEINCKDVTFKEFFQK